MSEVMERWSLPEIQEPKQKRYGQLSLVAVSPKTGGVPDTPQGTGVSSVDATAAGSNDGLDHPDESEHARRIAVAYTVLGEIAAAEKAMRRVYRRQTGAQLTSLPHRHPDIAGSMTECAICAAYGASSLLMAKLLTSKLESIPLVHVTNEEGPGFRRSIDGTLYRRSLAETYLVTGHEAISPQDLYEMLGDYWWDTLSFAIGVSTMHPRELAELALLLPAAPSPFSGAPAPIAVKWLTDAALTHLRQLVSHRRSWAAIRNRIVAEIDQRSRGSRRGEPAESLELEFWRLTVPRG
jgi:hypothetical protein